MAKSRKGRFGARSQRREAVAFSYATPQKQDYKVIEYGKENKLPHEMIRTFSESPTAALCWEKKAKFIKADGFASGATGKLRVNSDQTLDDLLPEMAFDAAPFGFALRVKYNSLGNVGEIYHVPFQHVLKLTDGRFLVNPTLGSKEYKKEQDELLDAFDDSPETVRQIIQRAQQLDTIEAKPENQPGQLLYVYVKNSTRPHYPVPACWAGKVDMETEPYILKADKKGLIDRVRAGIKVYVPGNIDTETKDEQGLTDLDRIYDNVSSLFDENTLFAVFSGPTKDDAVQLEFLDSFASLGSSQQMRETIGRAICRWWGIPPELIGWSTPGQLGNKEQLSTIVGMLQQDVLDIQGLIQRTVERLFPAFDGTLTNYNILGDIPSHVWELMTPDEKRNAAGLTELENTNTPKNGANASGFLGLRAFFKKRS
jgi:hypothetical protein